VEEISNDIYESREDYLKAIYIISKRKRGGWVSNSEIADYLKIRPPSVTGMLYKLKKNNLIFWKPRRSLRLSSEGKMIAKKILTRYNILKSFFINTLKINDKYLLNKLCCGIEHHITSEVTEALDNFTHNN